MFEERALQRSELVPLGETFHRRDVTTVRLQGEVAARVHGLAVQQHHAGAALGVVAPLLRTDQPDHVADGVEEALVGIELHRVGGAVHVQRGGNVHAVAPPA